jgi:hypothetical protein
LIQQSGAIPAKCDQSCLLKKSSRIVEKGFTKLNKESGEDMNIKKQLLGLLKKTVVELVNGDFESVKVKLGNDIELEDIKEELSYWDSLTIPPESAYEKVDFYEYKDGSGLALDFDLWIDNEESDLTLSCQAILDEHDNVLSFKIENLHTL